MDSTETTFAKNYAEQLTTQMRKGLLSYLVLIIAREPTYTSDIIRNLSRSGMTVVEGTIYPLLMRLQRDGLLEYEWHESAQGPPRKYYSVTELGAAVTHELKREIKIINQTTRQLESLKSDKENPGEREKKGKGGKMPKQPTNRKGAKK